MESSTPKCPSCGYEFDTEETWYSDYSDNPVNTGDCEESDLVCLNLDCRKNFKVVCLYIPTFSITKD